MIGNDIIDLAIARKESNWKRKGFLDKIFTQEEQLLIANAKNPTIMVWNLWSRKEAAYKIYNRETKIRAFIPQQLRCLYESDTAGTISCNGFVYYTQTRITNNSIYSEAVAKPDLFHQIRKISLNDKIQKINGIPFVIDTQMDVMKPVSISHHGQFWEGITI